jgi:hypothetical protein
VPANGCLPWTATNIDVPCQATAATNLAAVVALPRARLVIVAFNWSELSGDLVDRSGHAVALGPIAGRVAPLDATIAALRAAGKNVIVVGPIAVPGWDVASILSRELAFGRLVDQPLASSAASFNAVYGPVLAVLGKRRDIAIIRPDRIQCRAARCDYIRDGISLFADDNHLASASTGIFRPAFEPAIVAAAAAHTGNAKVAFVGQRCRAALRSSCGGPSGCKPRRWQSCAAAAARPSAASTSTPAGRPSSARSQGGAG